MYDINCDGQITKEEMTDIVTAIYNLMGHPVEEKIDDDRIKAKVDRIFDVSRNVPWRTQTYDLHISIKNALGESCRCLPPPECCRSFFFSTTVNNIIQLRE